MSATIRTPDDGNQSSNQYDPFGTCSICVSVGNAAQSCFKDSPPTPKAARASEGNPIWNFAPGAPINVIARAAKRAVGVRREGREVSIGAQEVDRPRDSERDGDSQPIMTGGQH